MDLNNKIEYISDFGKEICLQNLLLSSKIRDDLEKKGDISGAEKISREIIPVYEKIYNSFDINIVKGLCSDEVTVNACNKIFEKLLKDTGFEKEFIESQLMKRKEIKGKSGAEVLKKFFSYNLKEAKKIKGSLLSKINKILDNEEKLNLELSNSIQEMEQIEIIEKLQPIRKEFRKFEEKLNFYVLKIKNFEEKLEKKWPYEIYGTIEEKKFLEIYNDFFNK